MNTPITITCALILAAAIVLPGRHASSAPRPPSLRIHVMRTVAPATFELPAKTLPAIRGQIVAPMNIEAADVLARATMVQVRVRNTADTAQVLHWDVAHDPRLILAGGAEIRPLGHKLHGLSAEVLAVSGVLEVTLPAHGVYDLYPVYPTTSWARARRVKFHEVSVPKSDKHRARVKTQPTIATGTD